MDDAEQPTGVLSLAWPVAAVAVVLTGLSPFVLGVGEMRGVAVGGALATANLAAIGFVVRGVLRGAMLSWGSLAAVKFAALLFVTFIIVRNHWAGIIPLALGYAALPLGVVVGQLARATPVRKEEG
jgi:hypothetical protein